MIAAISEHKDNVFTFVYSRKLLNADALQELDNFARLFNIRTLAVEDIIAAENEKTLEILDRNYLQIIEQVYFALLESKQTTLTAMLSDLVRIITADQGIYTDFDYYLDTRELQEWHEVQPPIVMNIRMDNFAINNNFLAITSNKNHETSTQASKAVSILKEIITSKFNRFNKNPDNIVNILAPNANILKVDHLSSAMVFIKPLVEKFLSSPEKSKSLTNFIIFCCNIDNLDNIAPEDFGILKTHIIMILVRYTTGPSMYSEYLLRLSSAEELVKYSDVLNAGSNYIESHDSDLSWINSRHILNKKGANTFKTKIFKKIDSLNDYYHYQIGKIDLEKIDIARYLYMENIKYNCIELLRNIECKNKNVNYDLWYSADQINRLLHEFLDNDNVYIAAHTQNGHSVVAENIATSVSYAIEGRVAVIPIFIDNHWVSFALRQNPATRIFEGVFIDSLGHNFNFYNNAVIMDVINTLTNNNFILIDGANFNLVQQRGNGNDCGVWTVSNLVNIARYMQNNPESINGRELIMDNLDMSASTLRIYYDSILEGHSVRLENETQQLLNFDYLLALPVDDSQGVGWLISGILQIFGNY